MRTVRRPACDARGVEPTVEAVIVHHRTPEALRRTLEQLAAHAPAVPVTVVDTAMDDAVALALAAAHPRLRWLSAPNHSYAHAVNTGLKATTAPLVATMNADVLVGPRTLEDLCAPFADARVAFSGPVARTPAGRVQDQGVPYRWHHARLRRRSRRRAAGEAPSWVVVPWLSGCLLVARRAAIERIGGMDGRLRFYNEDLEWCARGRAAGWRCALVATEVVHLGGAATPDDRRFLIEGLRGGYTLTRRTAVPAARWAHRWAVAAAAGLAAAGARDPGRRAAWREVARRFARGELDDSPFGATLSDDAETTPRER
jgi:N-acetylglucosaminyl-diphospho-decaprenol L-rhamnosyltransferase